MPMFNDVLYFPIITIVEDELGQTESIEHYTRMVFCDEKGVPQSEFFSAGQSGIKAAKKLIINTMDYQDELKLKFKDKVYVVYRTYPRDDEKTELYCEVKVGG